MIYYPTSRTLFEVRSVEHENPFYQQGKNYVFKLTCHTFEYAHEGMNTGVVDIDEIAIDLLNNDDVVNDLFANNTEIETIAEPSQDTTVSNPFGNY